MRTIFVARFHKFVTAMLHKISSMYKNMVRHKQVCFASVVLLFNSIKLCMRVKRLIFVYNFRFSIGNK